MLSGRCSLPPRRRRRVPNPAPTSPSSSPTPVSPPHPTCTSNPPPKPRPATVSPPEAPPHPPPSPRPRVAKSTRRGTRPPFSSLFSRAFARASATTSGRSVITHTNPPSSLDAISLDATSSVANPVPAPSSSVVVGARVPVSTLPRREPFPHVLAPDVFPQKRARVPHGESRPRDAIVVVVVVVVVSSSRRRCRGRFRERLRRRVLSNENPVHDARIDKFFLKRQSPPSPLARHGARRDATRRDDVHFGWIRFDSPHAPTRAIDPSFDARAATTTSGTSRSTSRARPSRRWSFDAAMRASGRLRATLFGDGADYESRACARARTRSTRAMTPTIITLPTMSSTRRRCARSGRRWRWRGAARRRSSREDARERRDEGKRTRGAVSRGFWANRRRVWTMRARTRGCGDVSFGRERCAGRRGSRRRAAGTRDARRTRFSRRFRRDACRMRRSRARSRY